jgi:hypothetical protein
LIAYNKNSRQIDTAIAKQAITDVSSSRKAARRPARLILAWAAAALVVSAATVLALFYLPRQGTDARTAAAEAAFKRHITALAAGPQTDQWQPLLTNLAAVWGSPPPIKPMGGSLEQAIQALGLSVYRYSGNLGGIIRLGYPALLECALPTGGARRYLLLIAIQQDQATLLTGGNEPLQMPLQRLEQYWTGKALIPWDNPADLPVPFGRDATQTEREQLARLLNAAGVLPQEDRSSSGIGLRAAILRFQTRQGISPTGTAGVQTLMQLYRFSHPTRIPSLTTTEQTP